MKKFDVVAVGELLIDFINNGITEEKNPTFEANPGGAPCNVLAMLSKLGKKTAFIGKIGDDSFGKFLKDTVSDAGIDVSNVIMDNFNTTLALVHKLANGDRDFSFYRKHCADIMLKKEEIDIEMLKDTKIFHFGSLSLSDEPSNEATKYAVDIAKSNNALISFDPNLRPPLWDSLEDAKEEILYGLSKCDILKISDNELSFVTGIDDYDEAIYSLKKKFDNIKIIFLTMGEAGSKALYNDMLVEQKSILQNNVVDTTGAGDTFFGCALSKLLEYDINNINKEDIKNILIFANAGASLIVNKKGALKAMPSKEDIQDIISKNI